MNKGGRPFRSKLIPYLERIRSMRKGGASYEEISDALNKDYGINTHKSTVHDFVRVRAKGLRQFYALPENGTSSGKAPMPAAGGKSSPEGVFSMLRRVARERTEAAQEKEKKRKNGFTFDETQPIR
jgi:hypothetical protein